MHFKLAFSLCLFGASLIAEDASELAYHQYKSCVDDIETSFAEKMAKELNLFWSGTRHRMHEKIEMMGLDFQTQRRATLEEARALELFVLKQFLETINTHKAIQPYLEHTPFKRAYISIAFNGIAGRQSDGTVSQIFNTDGSEETSKIIYSSKDPFNAELVTLLEETYADAKERNALANIDPSIHTPLKGEKEMDAFLSQFIGRVADSSLLTVRSIGAKLNEGKLQEIGARLTWFQEADRDKAREKIVEATELLTRMINQDPAIRPFLKEHPFQTSHLKIRLNFCDPHYGRYHNGKIESVSLTNNQLTYFHDIPDEGNITFTVMPVLAEESYTEALEYVRSRPPSLRERFIDWLHTHWL